MDDYCGDGSNKLIPIVRFKYKWNFVRTEERIIKHHKTNNTRYMIVYQKKKKNTPYDYDMIWLWGFNYLINKIMFA